MVVCAGIAFYCILQNLGSVALAVGQILSMLSPFLLGGAMAFILNVPMRTIERGVFRGAAGKVRRPLSLLLTLIAVIGVLVLASCVIGPGIGEAASSITAQIPYAIQRLQNHLEQLSAYLPQLQEYLGTLDFNWATISKRALEIAQAWGSGLVNSGGVLIGGVVSGVSTFVIALIFSFYILLQKEKLSRQGRQVLYALLPERGADRALEILRLSERTFSSFLSGQCLEAVILGTLFVISMTIFRLPYALLVGVLISLTALIPIAVSYTHLTLPTIA